jgi:5-methylcytosine-specific restriction protein B
VADWRDADAEAAELFDAWSAGPGSQSKPVQRYRVVTFHPSYSYEDFVIGLRPVALEEGAEGGVASGFRLVDGVFKQICSDARANPGKRYGLFIDEINRANIAKVFGELITLVEPDKRTRYNAEGSLVGGMEVQLPGTGVEEGEGERFGVPENLDIYGTMNTADRSIALLDIALRRRFEFEEVPPEYGVLDRRVEGVDLGRLLRAINDRLEFLADRDRRIGHAYFTKVASLDDLRSSFRRQVIPLLQEFFFDDWGRVALVLSGRNGRSAFVRRELLDGGKLFGNASELQSERFRYEVTAENGWTAEAFRSIYQDDAAPKPAAE